MESREEKLARIKREIRDGTFFANRAEDEEQAFRRLMEDATQDDRKPWEQPADWWTK